MPKQQPLAQFGTGQVTLPKWFRDRHKTKYYMSAERGRSLIITPLSSDNILGVEEVDEDINEPGWTSVLDAKKLGYPRGIPAELVLRALRELREKEDGQNKKAYQKAHAKKARPC